MLPLADRYHIPYPVARSRRSARRELTVREHARRARRVEVPRSALALHRSRPRRARRRLQARARSTTSSTAPRDPPLVGPRFPRGARHRRVPALGHRRERQSLRGRARARLSLRRLAERPLPAPHALPRARRGRAGAHGVRRGDAARRGRRGAANSTCASASLRSTRSDAVGSLSPFRRRAAIRHRPARRLLDACARATPRRSSPPTRRPSTGAATRRSSTPTSTGARDAEPRRFRAHVSLRGHAAHARRAAAARGGLRTPAAAGFTSFNVVDYSPLLRARARQSRPLGERRRRAAAERVPAPRRRHRGRSRIAARRSTQRFPARASPSASRGRAARLRARGRARHRRSCRPSGRAVSRRSSPRVDADGNERAGIRPPELRGAARDLHRLEPAPSRAGRRRATSCR